MGAGMSRVWCKSIQRMAFQPPQVDFSIHYNTCFVRAIDGNNIVDVCPPVRARLGLHSLTRRRRMYDCKHSRSN